MKGLREIRKKKRYSQLKVAMDLNISREALSYYETSKRDPDIEMLRKLSSYFNVSIDYLITGSEFKPKEYKNHRPFDLWLFCLRNHAVFVFGRHQLFQTDDLGAKREHLHCGGDLLHGGKRRRNADIAVAYIHSHRMRGTGRGEFHTVCLAHGNNA